MLLHVATHTHRHKVRHITVTISLQMHEKKTPLSTKHLQNRICTRRKHIYKFSSEHPNSERSSKNEIYDSFLYRRSWKFHLQSKQNQFSVLITYKHNVSLSARAEHTYRCTATCQPCPSVMLNHLGIPVLVASLVDLNSGHWRYNK